jgi:hypothetical protein
MSFNGGNGCFIAELFNCRIVEFPFLTAAMAVSLSNYQIVKLLKACRSTAAMAVSLPNCSIAELSNFP